MIRDYIFFDGRRIAWRDSSGYIHYYFADVLGSTRAVTDSSGNTCFEADYYPYGQETTPANVTNSCSPTYEFAGYEFDSETGNYYAYARYYDPQLGRFLSPDPLGGAVGAPQSLNRYAYVLNNPESLIDPYGLYSNCVYEEATNTWFCTEVDGGGGGGGGGNPPCSMLAVYGGGGDMAACAIRTDLRYGLAGGCQSPGGGGHGHTGVQKQQPLTQVSCAALREEAAQLGATLESISHAAALGATALWISTGLGAALVPASFGAGAPVEIALGSMAAFFTAGAIDTGAVASALDSFAGGNLNPLESFAFNQIEDLALKGLSSGLPEVGPWAEHLTEAAQQAQDLANEAPGACK
jgi:RHS repeat-associated protein